MIKAVAILSADAIAEVIGGLASRALRVIVKRPFAFSVYGRIKQLSFLDTTILEDVADSPMDAIALAAAYAEHCFEQKPVFFRWLDDRAAIDWMISAKALQLHRNLVLQELG